MAIRTPKGNSKPSFMKQSCFSFGNDCLTVASKRNSQNAILWITCGYTSNDPLRISSPLNHTENASMDGLQIEDPDTGKWTEKFSLANHGLDDVAKNL